MSQLAAVVCGDPGWRRALATIAASSVAARSDGRPPSSFTRRASALRRDISLDTRTACSCPSSCNTRSAAKRYISDAAAAGVSAFRAGGVVGRPSSGNSLAWVAITASITIFKSIDRALLFIRRVRKWTIGFDQPQRHGVVV